MIAELLDSYNITEIIVGLVELGIIPFIGYQYRRIARKRAYIRKLEKENNELKQELSTAQLELRLKSKQ